MRRAAVVVCLVSVVATLTLAPPGSQYPRKQAKQRHPQPWQRSQHPTRKSSPQLTTPRDGLKPGDKKNLSIGVVLPHSTFQRRRYEKAIKEALFNMQRDPILHETFRHYHFTYDEVVLSTMHHSSSPTKILETLCDSFLPSNVSAILYLFNSETYGRSTASVQYFFQLAGYLGIPVIAWNADNSGLERDRRTSSPQLQLAPSIEHQAAAMLSILQRYSWPKFAVVTSLIAGHNDFIQALRDLILELPAKRFTITNTVRVSDPEIDLRELVSSEARILFLYSTRQEAAAIMSSAQRLGLNGTNYLWIVTQSVIQSNADAPGEFPVGMLGVHFKTTEEALIEEIKNAMLVFGWGLHGHVKDEMSRNVVPSLAPALSCDTGDARWRGGDKFYRFLKNVSLQADNKPATPKLEFNNDGTRRAVALRIMNLRPDVSRKLTWEEIGVWRSGKEQAGSLEVKDIVWPGYSHVPPNGIPEKFHLKITFMEEPPFINMDPPNPETGMCTANKGVHCRIASDEMMQEVNVSWAMRNSSYFRCCSGFCIDLLVKFSQDLGFSYDFFRVEDGFWGAIVNGKWTGLPGAIINGKADMIMTSIKINSEREEVLDFTVPFLDTGIAIVVAKRTGIISPTAFLEPFDTASWMLVALVAIQVAAVSIFLFEWLSPSGYNMKLQPTASHRFSLCRTLWMVWAILFQAAVNVDCPRGYTARFMGNVWAMFALIFLAIYTANLAAFMITREEFYDLSGIEDKRLQNPTSMKPPFKFATTLHGNTDVLMKKSFPVMHAYMRQFNQTSPVEGVRAVKKGNLDAFLYDATVMEYLVGQDDECRLLTVGSWYALTGYGVAFARKSKYLEMFNELIMKYRENGDLERIARFWFTGACRPNKQQKSSSKPLALEQFMSTFLLLGCGILLALLLLGFEHIYFKYFRQYVAKSEKGSCCSLLSMSMGKSLSLRGAVQEAQDVLRTHRCQDPLCDTHLWRVKHELDMARLRIHHLERQMVTHGLRPAAKEGSTPATPDPSKPREETRNHVIANEPIRGPLLAARTPTICEAPPSCLCGEDDLQSSYSFLEWQHETSETRSGGVGNRSLRSTQDLVAWPTTTPKVKYYRLKV
ncbi:glutamate receptor ionotropic, NMDA 2B-like isoform X3 [Portunus trituberculatus]|uniref:glutamate receptor ionotropic, NMDA 2B-like isoform X3 n=1 Tax=Portunus trituberculatus TaxID=210409 RepID=UPI001E1CE226|nr:glutamate receptor ionotropic, NMDA 2B-like isoform X3 [Portunus trituberculatus]